jgi:hypothetical protein
MANRNKRPEATKAPPKTQSTLNKYAALRSSSGSPAHKKVDDRSTPKRRGGRGRGGGIDKKGNTNRFESLQESEDAASTVDEQLEDALLVDTARTSNVDILGDRPILLTPTVPPAIPEVGMIIASSTF